jgi:hypothetical protein
MALVKPGRAAPVSHLGVVGSGIVLSIILSASSATAAELAHLRVMRSLVSEAGLVLRLNAQHRLSPIYVSETKTMVRQQLLSELDAEGRRSQEAELVRAVLAALQAGDQRRLDEIQQQLTYLVNVREQGS